ncbi:MAG: transcriptional repressor, partial [Thermodesulfobacteriota bacterium]
MKKLNKHRQIILNVLKGVKTHPTADWIYEELKKEIPNISLGTVYRNLTYLKENNFILKL